MTRRIYELRETDTEVVRIDLDQVCLARRVDHHTEEEKGATVTVRFAGGTEYLLYGDAALRFWAEYHATI